jgi:hypothetical protein
VLRFVVFIWAVAWKKFCTSGVCTSSDCHDCISPQSCCIVHKSWCNRQVFLILLHIPFNSLPVCCNLICLMSALSSWHECCLNNTDSNQGWIMMPVSTLNGIRVKSLSVLAFLHYIDGCYLIWISGPHLMANPGYSRSSGSQVRRPLISWYI